MLGESNKQIARRLGISNYTVRDHVSNLLKKAGVTSRSRLALVISAPIAHAVHEPAAARARRIAALRRGRNPAAGRTRSSAGHRSVLEDTTMKPIEDRELDEVAGANTQQELFDFVERVLRDLQRMWDQPAEPAGF